MAGDDDAAAVEASDLDDRVAAIYGGPLPSFVSERDALVRELRSAGRRDEAARVKALRKPKLVAWALDAGTRADPAALADLAAAVEALRESQAGGGDLRAAIADLRAAEGPVVDAVGDAARDYGQPVERTALAAALRAVVGDAEALAALRAGRLVDVPATGGLGVAPAGAAPAPAPRSPPIAEERPRRAGARPKEARGRTAAARRAVAGAERAARQAADAARAAAASADEAEASARNLQDQATAAQRRADGASAAARQARHEAEDRATARDEAEAALARARAALRALDG